MSLRLVPSKAPKSATVQDTAGSLGLHDTLVHGPRSLAAEVKEYSTLRHRLQNWEETQDNLKLTLQRNTLGMHAPMRTLMERKLVNTHSSPFATSNVHLDILMGRDEEITPADVFQGPESNLPLDLHKEFEKRFKH
ncbi:proteasome maturation factor UMP1 [Coprinopsis sp. MPI-PUGE-AT-0042]|nr:proteasome maturation factor UMP1 [Coprinopsis sp. MPI-PUGE-AT-0042]